MEEQTQINYRMTGAYVLLHAPNKTEGGILLLSGSRTTEDYTVALVGETCTYAKVGDRVVIDGGVTLWNIDGEEYWQIHETQIVGYVLNDGKIMKGTMPDHTPADPTAHYNQNR